MQHIDRLIALYEKRSLSNAELKAIVDEVQAQGLKLPTIRAESLQKIATCETREINGTLYHEWKLPVIQSEAFELIKVIATPNDDKQIADIEEATVKPWKRRVLRTSQQRNYPQKPSNALSLRPKTQSQRKITRRSRTKS